VDTVYPGLGTCFAQNNGPQDSDRPADQGCFARLLAQTATEALRCFVTVMFRT
jgi:hypothetical protein